MNYRCVTNLSNGMNDVYLSYVLWKLDIRQLYSTSLFKANRYAKR